MYNSKLKAVHDHMRNFDAKYRNFHGRTSVKSIGDGSSIEIFISHMGSTYPIAAIPITEYYDRIGKPCEHTALNRSFFTYHYLLDTAQMDKYESKCRELNLN